MAEMCKAITLKVNVPPPITLAVNFKGEFLSSSDGEDYKRGYEEGHAQGLIDGRADGYESGYQEGHKVGSESGYQTGKDDNGKQWSEISMEKKAEIEAQMYEDATDDTATVEDYQNALTQLGG